MKGFQMKKIAASTIAAAALFVAMAPAQATTSTQTFNVTAALAAKCTTVAPANLDFGTYTAFQTTASTPTTTFTLTCSRGLTAPTYSFADPDQYGLIAGLNYSLSASAGAVSAGTAATATLNGIGSGDTRTVTISGNMASGQAGDCAGNAASCAGQITQVRTLTITY